MEVKNYHTTAVQICGECQGEGSKLTAVVVYRHGSTDDQDRTRCATCDGTGRVKITKDITLTIAPHVQHAIK